MRQSYYSYTLKAKLDIEGDEASGYTATLREDEHPEIADIFGYGLSPSDAAHDLAAALSDAGVHLAEVDA